MLIRFVISELKVILASSICAHLSVYASMRACVCLQGVLFVTSVCVLIQYLSTSLQRMHVSHSFAAAQTFSQLYYLPLFHH